METRIGPSKENLSYQPETDFRQELRLRPGTENQAVQVLGNKASVNRAINIGISSVSSDFKVNS